MAFESLRRTMMVSKIHRATVTQSDLHYVGSVTIDATLMEHADILPGQKVDIVDVTNGNRLTTYAIPGAPDTGQVCINGAAAHLVQPGDLVIVIGYASMSDEDARHYEPKVVFVDGDNRIVHECDEPGAVPADSDLEPSGLTIHQFRTEGWQAYRH